MIPAQRLIDEARSWVGVPFLHQGRSRQGIDCIGLVLVAMWRTGALSESYHVADYGRLPHKDRLLNALRLDCARIEHPVPGCLVGIRWTRSVAHVALCTGPTIIHSYEGVGCVVEHSYASRWVRMTHSLWALPGIEYE